MADGKLENSCEKLIKCTIKHQQQAGPSTLLVVMPDEEAHGPMTFIKNVPSLIQHSYILQKAKKH